MKRTLVVVVVAAAVLVAWPETAQACGGFFCSRSAPIDQSGENIVFAVGADGTLETHVQILYSGDAERFAWIVPVPALPEISLGTDALFVGLSAATTPRFELRRVTEGTCRRRERCNHPASCYGPPRDSGAFPAAPADMSSADAGVTVHVEASVGAFDAVVLEATDATTLHTWLAEHEYDLPAASIPLLQAYVDAGDFFVALRLESGRSTGEIQPIVLRYREDEPCIPIRLTAISTVPDLPITAYVLGSAYATPRNYSFLELESASLWLGSSYTSEVTRAADEAGGRAFATDYAGAPPRLGLTLPSIDDLRTAASPAVLVSALASRRYPPDAQLFAVLRRLIPPPPGMDSQTYLNCLAGGGCRDYVPAGWDASAVVDAIEEAIVEPRANADALLAGHSHLTRLFTTMSAPEMTVDPVFQLDEGLAEVPQTRIATLVTECTPDHFESQAPQRIELPSGRVERVRAGTIDTRDDEAICNASGGTLGTPPEPMCPPGTPGSRDAGTSGSRDGGARSDAGRMDGSAADGFAVTGGGLCSVAAGASSSHRRSAAAASFVLACALVLGALRRRRR